MKKISIFTDGACSGNPGPGGWGALLIYNDHQKEIKGGEKDTTNNRMELLAAIKALQSLTETCEVDITTDSVYVQKGMTQWLSQWKKRNWKTANKRPVKNVDLWQQLEAEVAKHKVTWHWIKGHAGHPENERADTLARQGIETLTWD